MEINMSTQPTWSLSNNNGTYQTPFQATTMIPTCTKKLLAEPNVPTATHN